MSLLLLFLPILSIEEQRETPFIQQIRDVQRNPVRQPIKRLTLPELHPTFKVRFEAFPVFNPTQMLHYSVKPKNWLGPTSDGLTRILLEFAVMYSGGNGSFYKSETQSEKKKPYRPH